MSPRRHLSRRETARGRSRAAGSRESRCCCNRDPPRRRRTRHSAWRRRQWNRARQIVALKATDHRDCERARQVRILPERFRDATPARIARDIHHRREGPVDPVRGGLARGHAGSLPDEIGIPACGLADWDRSDGLVPVDHVLPEDERDAGARLLRCDALRFGLLRRACRR